MSKLKLKIFVVAALFVGMIISAWSYYFIEYSYSHDFSYGLAADCPERPNDGDCIPLSDYYTSGFPMQFGKKDFLYDLRGEPLSEGATVFIDQSFSWPLFMLNTLIWAIPVFMTLFTINGILGQKRKKRRK